MKPTVGKAAGARKTKTANNGGLLEDEHDSAYAGLYSHSELGYGLKGGGGINADLLVDEAEEDAAGEEEGSEATFIDKLPAPVKLVFGFSASIFSG